MHSKEYFSLFLNFILSLNFQRPKWISKNARVLLKQRLPRYLIGSWFVTFKKKSWNQFKKKFCTFGLFTFRGEMFKILGLGIGSRVEQSKQILMGRVIIIKFHLYPYLFLKWLSGLVSSLSGFSIYQLLSINNWKKY